MNSLISFTHELIANSEYKSISDIQNYFTKLNCSLEDILKRDEVPKHLKGLSKDEAFLKILNNTAIHSILILGINDAFAKNDMSILNDAIFTYNRIDFSKRALLNSQTDHSIHWLKAIEIFAAMDLKLISKAFPQEKGLTSNGHPFNVTCSNLLISLLNRDPDWIRNSINRGEEFLSQKHPQFDKEIINYLLAIYKEDISSISDSLRSITKLYGKAKSIHEFNNPVYRKLGLLIHGLYNFAYHSLPKELFENIPYPKTDVFVIELADFQKASNYPVENPSFIFENELSYLNDQIFKQ